MPSCIRDAAPDAWGRRVLINRLMGAPGTEVDTAELDELTYLLESGSDRVGALDFQRSATEYVPRNPSNATLRELMQSANLVERGVPLPAELGEALQHGTAIGGARPKALIQNGNVKYIAKFSSSTDVYSIVKAEFIAMRLARHAGLDVAPVTLKRASNKDVLLVERFDRVRTKGGWRRGMIVSALTLFGLDAMMARYARATKPSRKSFVIASPTPPRPCVSFTPAWSSTSCVATRTIMPATTPRSGTVSG